VQPATLVANTGADGVWGEVELLNELLTQDTSGAPEKAIETDLKLVAGSFVKLQQARHSADYDNSRTWSRIQVWEAIVQAEDAIAAWSRIQQESAAQDYLFDLMGTR
jgi:hypothetical protein